MGGTIVRKREGKGGEDYPPRFFGNKKEMGGGRDGPRGEGV
jgi:hypothetical protein